MRRFPGGEDMEEKRVMPQRSIVEETGGMIGKYMKRVVGSKSPVYFLKYELLITLLSNCPGAAGLFLRHIFYPGLFGFPVKGVHFGRGITLRGPLKIALGKGSMLDDFVVLDSKSEFKPGIVLGERCLVSRNTKISTGYTGYVKIGTHTIIGENCIVHGPGGIEIGNDVLISDSVLLNAGSHLWSDPEKTILSQGITAKGIKIGSDVWLGTGVIVKDGLTIGQGCVVEAGTLVNSSLPDYSIVSGVPAKVIRSRK